LPVAEWLRQQKRFDHLFRPQGAEMLDELQNQVDEDWAALLERCGA
jgi:pyruvate ferredoxin oxidoreductase beta subunit